MLKKYILAIETSCDDTSIAILDDYTVVTCVTKDSTKELNHYGGIVPEIASRKHEEYIIDIYKQCLHESKINPEEIGYICYTNEPGLPGSLHVGEIFAKSLAYFLNIEAYPINHIHAHIFSAFINTKHIDYPFLSLIASGKTTSIFLIEGPTKILELIKTNDDAIGETFDKIAKKLGLGYPGGPKIDSLFDKSKASLMLPKQSVLDNFSFSGIKSHVLRMIDQQIKSNTLDVVTIASSFMNWAINTLIEKLNYFKTKYGINNICIGGGVASNSLFKSEIKKTFKNSFVPLKEFSCDNAAMIGYLFYQANLFKK